MSSQTQSSVDVNEETWESLRDTITSLIREELEQLRDEMRKYSRAICIEFPRFGGDDVKGYGLGDLQRFGNVETAKFSYNGVMNSSLSLNLDDDEDYVVYGCYQERDEKDKCAHKMFDEMPIKKILKQDIIAEYSDV
ncbi:hypothetical protein Tco_1335175 [Tanacetum coccineum]